MNYRQIEIFVAVLECGSLTEAAAQLGLSQPAVSKSLKNLEESLDVQLFHRQNRSIEATTEGRALYLESKRMLESFSNLGSFARNLPRMAHLRLKICCMPAVGLCWLPEAVRAFLVLHPEASFGIEVRSSIETVQRVAAGEVDIGISQMRPEDTSARRVHLLENRLVAAVPHGHPLAEKPILSLEDLHGRDMMTATRFGELGRRFEIEMDLRGYDFSSRVEASTGMTLMRMVGPGTEIGLIDNLSARMHSGDLSVLRPIEPKVAIPIYLLEHVGRPRGLLAQLFIDHLLEFARDHDGTDGNPRYGSDEIQTQGYESRDGLKSGD